jgi:Sec-independent protein translocase protein TatA
MTTKKVVPKKKLPAMEDDLVNWVSGARSMAGDLYVQLEEIEEALKRKLKPRK